jgi:GrpB-like predicted nucleotidyltransferase (UPF0157 family)
VNDPRVDPLSPEQRREPVVVVPYDPAWPEASARVRTRIAGVLGDVVLGIEHVGSTAVPGLDAKPIIDIDAVVRPEQDLAVVVERLATLGYRHLGDLGIIGREAFRAPADDDLPRHHLYVCPAGSPVLNAHLLLRDELRADPALAAEYGALKRALAERHRDDRDAYTEGKTRFITGVLLRARDADQRARKR